MIDKNQQNKMRVLILGTEISRYAPTYNQTECDMCGWLMLKLIDELWAVRHDEKKIKSLYN